MITELKFPAFPKEMIEAYTPDQMPRLIKYWVRLVLMGRLGHHRKIHCSAYRRVDTLSYGIIVFVDNQEFSCELDEDLSDWWPFHSMLIEIDLTI